MKQHPGETPRRGRPPLPAHEVALKRQRIAEAARRLFVNDGYSGVSMRKVAEAADMTPMTLYHYFDSKIDVLRYLWADVLHELFNELERVAKLERSTKRRLSKVSVLYVRYWIDHPDHYRMVFMSEGVSQPAVSIFVQQDPIAIRYALFAKCMSEATKADIHSASLLSELLVCTLNGIAHNHVTISGYRWRPPEQLVDVLLTALTASANKATR
jgi:AcrR family transcriptional regulator